ncbi:MAG TPA: PEP-CTERM sorting domain-containing protein [Desulfobulbaceae bacterium]|nr:PEP-CTERM sorting domain-containing protein [Desulfobulbaceae bacterium]
MKKAMAKSGLLVVLVLGLGVVTGTAQATPVTFSGATGGVDLTTGWTWNPSGTLSLDAQLQVGPAFSEFTLDGTGIGPEFTLADGESQTIDFFELTAGGFGVGQYDIGASLDFDTPTMEPASGEGGGYFGTGDVPLFGRISGGTLSWDSQPGLITLADGNMLSISFEDFIVFGMGESKMVHATISNLGGGADNQMNPVPEPATMLLFGTGLAGLASLKYRKMKR